MIAIKESMTLDKLAEMSQKEFSAIRNEMVTGLSALSAELKSEIKSELGGLRSELKSEINSSRDYVVEEIKTFLHPHLRSLDSVLVDVEHLKNRLDKVERHIGISNL